MSSAIATRPGGAALLPSNDAVGVARSLRGFRSPAPGLISGDFGSLFGKDQLHLAVRVEITRLKGDFYRLTVQYGFKDEPDIPQALSLCAAQGLAIDMMETSFFLGRATLIPTVESGMALWREKLFVLMYRNASSATSFYKIPTNRVVELGTQVVI